MFKFYRRIIYPLRMRFIERPHIVKIDHPDVPKWEWRDRDTRLFHACFQVLRDFVEKEETLSGLMNKIESQANDEDLPQSHKDIDKEIFDLYIWYTVKREERPDPWDFDDSSFDRPSGLDWFKEPNSYPEYSAALKKAGELEAQQYQEDTDMLVRLMKVRGALWT